MRAVLISALLLAACSSDPQTPANDAGVGSDSGSIDVGFADSGFDSGNVTDTGFDAGFEADAEPVDALPEDTGPADSGPMTLMSSALAPGGVIPDRHSCNGLDLQPELTWTGVPAGTQSLALVLIDDSFNFVHWVALDLPPTLTELPEGASDNNQLPSGASEVDAYCVQYCGPCPQATNTYSFRLYALSVPMTTYNWPNGALRRANLAAAFDANTLSMATLTGTFTR